MRWRREGRREEKGEGQDENVKEGKEDTIIQMFPVQLRMQSNQALRSFSAKAP